MSSKLGELTRTNSEAIIGAQTERIRPDQDFSTGVAITSSFHPDANTHIEPVRYGKGSNAMALLQTLATKGGSGVARWRQLLRGVRRSPKEFLRLLRVHGWSQRTVILLVMQSLDNSLSTRVRRGLFGWRLTSRQGHGTPNPSYIPAGEEANERVADKIDGIAGGTWGELFDMPLTAHFIGGCPISSDAEHGVLDPYHRVHGYPTLSIVDGSAISANLGVNPSLTITAQAERAFSMWPNRGATDPRPDQSWSYQRVTPVAPASPSVPAGAPGALRTPSASG